MLAKILLIFLLYSNLSFLNAFQNYKISDLDIGDIQDIEGSQATCINNRGEVAGGLFIGGTNMHHSAFFWNKGTGLTEIFANKASPPSDINDASQIVGTIPEAYDPPRGYLWSLESGFISLNPFSVHAINDAGVMTGNDYCSRNSPKLVHIKTSLTSNGDKLNLEHHIPLNKIYNPYNYSEYANGINNKCEVVGSLHFIGTRLDNKYSASLQTHGFLWRPNGTCVDFGNHMIPTAINDLTQVILVSDFSEKGSSWLWEEGKSIPVWHNGLAQAINIKRVIVGSQNGNAVIWENDQLKNLFDLVVNKEGWSKLSMAMDINDQDEVVGRGIYKGKETAFLLVPCNP